MRLSAQEHHRLEQARAEGFRAGLRAASTLALGKADACRNSQLALEREARATYGARYENLVDTSNKLRAKAQIAAVMEIAQALAMTDSLRTLAQSILELKQGGRG